jgi:diguanylate cyclase (GGDEF)-like protein
LSPSSKIRAASREQAPAPEPLARAPSPIGSAPHKPGPSEACAAADDALDLEQILAGVKETAYRWDLASGRMIWAGNAAAVLDIADMAPLTNARAFALLVDPEHASLRYDAITGGLHPAPDCQVSYRIHYRLLPDGRRGRKVEDSGLCQIGSDLAPLRAQGTLRVIDDRREQEERLLHLSSHDELTGQLNRTRLTEELSLFLSDAGRFARKGAFLLVAVNDLTLINETYGFDMGDEVISIVGRRLGRILRGKDRIGRFSSNKFGILLGDCTADGVATIASRLMASVRDSVVDASAGAVATSVSIGALLLPSHASTAQAAIGNALQALEAARNDHGGRFALYHPSERRESERRRTVTIADEIVRALNDRRMILALQPIVTSGSRETEFYECLLRMKRLDGSIAAAAKFMPVAEQLGLAKLVDHRVLELAIELLRASPDIRLALNVSAATTTDSQWLQGLEAFTSTDGSSLTGRLTIEIAETAAIVDFAATAKFVAGVKALGCSVALDDFGAGYTSYRSLRALGVDMVKIDGSFIQNLGTEAEDERLVRTLIDLARSFGVTTVGERVGDEETARILEKAGIAYM